MHNEGTRRFLLWAFLLLPLRMWGSCSALPCAVTISTTAATASIASSSLGNSIIRIEARLIGVNWAATNNSNVLSFGGFGIAHLGAVNPNLIYFQCGPDTVPGGCGNFSPNVNFAGSAGNDILIRFTRNPSTMQQTLEVYDTQTGANLITSSSGTYTAPIVALASDASIQSSGVIVGGANATGTLAFLRVYSTTVAYGSAVQVGYNASNPAPLGDWEFNSSGADSSGLGETLSPLSGYTSAPKYAPSCNPGTAVTQTLGSIFLLSGLNSVPLDGGTALSYAWTSLTGSDGVSQGLTIVAPNNPITLTTPSTQFGSANFQLVVTDGSGVSTTCSVHNGVIIANPNGVINLTAEGVDQGSQHFVGPMIAFGQNTWPWADTVQAYTLARQINNLQNYYTPYWRTSLGTSSITAGSSHFTVASGGLAPCGGSGSTPLNNAWFIWNYTGTDSLQHYTMFPVVSCDSDTQITVNWAQNGNVPASAYPASPNAPWPTCSSACTGGWNWGYSDGSTPGTYSPQYQFGLWTYSGAPVNYYDNVKDFYIAYLRTGIDTYQFWFQTLADWFWEQPIMDQGYNCSSSNPVTNCFEPAAWRNMSMDGIFLRALQEGSSSSKWGGIHAVEAGAATYIGTSVPGATPFSSVDERESGYAMSVLAMCGIADPSPAAMTMCQATLKNSLAFWTASQRADLGNGWGGFYANSAPGATSIAAWGGSGTACVQPGSTTVTGTGTNWTTALYGGGSGISIWFFSGSPTAFPATNSAGDSDIYFVTVNSPTSLTLDRPYDGTPGCTGISGFDKGFVVGYPEGIAPNGGSGGFSGWGDQPTYDGHLAQAFFLAAQAIAGSDAASQALFNQYGDALVQRVITYGINPGTGGLYNGIFMAGCTTFPIPSTNVPCYPGGGGPDGNRVLSMELPRAFAMDYQLFSNPAVKATMDLLMTQMWSKPGTGGPTGDGYYLDQYDVGGFFVTGIPLLGSAPKWTGQQCGHTEACSMWPAVRLGNLALQAGTTVSGAAAVSGAAVIK